MQLQNIFQDYDRLSHTNYCITKSCLAALQGKQGAKISHYSKYVYYQEISGPSK